LEDFVEAKFYCPHAYADGNSHISAININNFQRVCQTMKIPDTKWYAKTTCRCWEPTHCKAPFTRYNLLSNRFSNRFDNRLNVCIHDTTGLTTG